MGLFVGVFFVDVVVLGVGLFVDVGFVVWVVVMVVFLVVDIEFCVNVLNVCSVVSVVCCILSVWIVDCSILRLSFSYCLIVCRLVICLLSFLMFVSGDIMLDMFDSDGGSLCVVFGNGVILLNGDIWIMFYIWFIMLVGWNLVKLVKGLVLEVLVVIWVFWLIGGVRWLLCVV